MPLFITRVLIGAITGAAVSIFINNFSTVNNLGSSYSGPLSEQRPRGNE